jgi:hypothetical protein
LRKRREREEEGGRREERGSYLVVGCDGDHLVRMPV